MNVYHVWCDLKEGQYDADFAEAVHGYLGRLRADGLIADYRLTRRKLGLGHPNLPEWHITIDFADMTQMDRAFESVSARADPIEGLHHAVNARVGHVFFALYRDFPDPGRSYGEERF